jgi:hypothetical protein
VKLSNRKSLRTIPLILMTVAGMATSALADNSGRGNANGSSNSASTNGALMGGHAVQNGRSAIKGNLWTRHHIYYVGDELEVRVQFPRGHDLLEAGEADAYVVVFATGGSIFDVPVPADVGAEPRKFFSIASVDLDKLPEGQYQLGLVLTVPDGDPALLEDWYGGFRALLDSEAIYVAAERVDGDADSDGELDDDEDGDGISGEEEDETDDDSPRGKSKK